MRVLALFVAATLTLDGVASAQSFNIDMGTMNPLPAAGFGAAAGQPGTWNQVPAQTPGVPQLLTDVAGAPTSAAVTMTTTGFPYDFWFDNTATLGDDDALMDDGIDPAGPTTYTFTGLAAGTYDVYTYAWAPDSNLYRSGVSINGSPVTSVGGTWPSGYLAPVTHALDTVTITAGQNIVLNLTIVTTFATFNGIQLKLTGTATTSFCDGSVTGACITCGNNGAAGNGCANSSFSAGAHLATTGNAGASTGTDTLVLTCTNMTGPGLFFQATGVGAATPFGDGELCASVGIIRMGVVFPGGPSPANTASYPGGTTSNPIHVAGGPLVAGDIRHYQCWYRDAITFCTTATFNLSQGVTLTWGP